LNATAANAIALRVSSVNQVEGDVDISQRKGKLIYIFDLLLDISWTATNPDGNESQGALKLTEFTHDATAVDDLEVS